MYLSRLTLNASRIAFNWLNNPYRIHQRLKMACDQDPRLLFRVEENDGVTRILVQSQVQPNWQLAFSDFEVLVRQPESKQFSVQLQAGRCYRFRLLANPTAKKTILKEGNEKRKLRVGLMKETEQRAWLERKFKIAGAEVVSCIIAPRGSQRSHKGSQRGEAAKPQGEQTHLAVLFEGDVRVIEPDVFEEALKNGIGSGKGYGFGLLSLASIAENL
jgi:CRISPR system Cascade subunit CasE